MCKEYIEREAVCYQLAKQATIDGQPRAIKRAAKIVANFPAADVRPVVLCRDCKWYEINELKKDGTEDRRYKPSVCMLAEQHREPNHFCADGEKREESE